MIRYIARLLRKLISDTSAGMAPVIAVGVLVLTIAMGVGVDAGRGYLVKSRLLQALDAAALAGGRVMFKPDRDEDIAKFFQANYPEGFMDSHVQQFNIVASEDGDQLELSAAIVMPTTLTRLIGYQDVTIRARTVVHRQTRGMELALVMDNTGSMAGAKINRMKDAAEDLVNILYGDDGDTAPNFWVGLVPYSATVNIGNHNFGWLGAGTYEPDDFLPGEWKGCVEARDFPYEEDQAEALPTGAMAQPFRPFLWESTEDEDFEDAYGNPHPGDNDWPPINQVYGTNEATGPNLGCPPEVTPLQVSRQTALDAIDDMALANRGGTFGNLGLAWAWRMLSPAWRDMWQGMPPGLPSDYDTALVDKVIVMLTDGENQWYDWPDHMPGCAGIPGPCVERDADYTAYGRLSEERLGTNNNGTAKNIINSRMTDLCAAMKQKNIIIYTIVLQVNDSSTQQLYRDCASEPEYYFLSPSSSDLEAIFKEIAEQLSNLRIAQ